jgi:hypothetical protein
MREVNNKYYTTRYLHTRLKAAGIENYTRLSNFTYKWLNVMEKSGRLICPRGGVNMNTRLFTKKQVDEIVEAFRPGGVGYWSYKGQLPPAKAGGL